MIKITSIFFLTLGIFASAQSFEGSVTYSIVIKNPDPSKIADSLYYRQIGVPDTTFQTTFYKMGMYLNHIKAKKSAYQLYNPADNKLYSWIGTGDTAAWTDVSYCPDSIQKVIEQPSDQLFQGKKMHKLIIRSDMGETTFWYVPKQWTINPKLYEKHCHGHFATFLKHAKSVPVMIQYRNSMVMIEYKAKEIKAHTVDPSQLVRPKARTLIESDPYEATH